MRYKFSNELSDEMILKYAHTINLRMCVGIKNNTIKQNNVYSKIGL